MSIKKLQDRRLPWPPLKCEIMYKMIESIHSDNLRFQIINIQFYALSSNICI